MSSLLVLVGRRRALLVMLGLLLSALAGQLQAQPGNGPPASFRSECMELRYSAPASIWLEALPIGNGRMGGMVFGGVSHERLQFNEQSLWLGTERTKEMGSYQPFGDLFLDLAHPAGAISSYSRVLDLQRAKVTVSYTVDGTEYRREYFASQPDDVIVIRLAASRPGQVSFTIGLKDVRPSTVLVHGQTLEFAGTMGHGLQAAGGGAAAPGETKVGGGEIANDLAYAAGVRVVPEGGKLHSTANGLTVESADAATLILSAGTSFANDPARRWRGEPPNARVSARLDAAERQTYAELKQAHEEDHRRLFDRVQLDLGASPISVLTTPERLGAVSQGLTDLALAALLFNYGRYLLIASSRPGGLPANLQGLWNEDVRPAWYSGYTTNINVEMNYWLAEMTALPECHEPLFDWVDNLAKVQKASSDPRLKTPVGWIAYSTNNPFGGNTGWAIHQPGSAWLARHFMDHFEFTGDRTFLARRAYPHLRELTRYWLDRLVAGPDGSLVTPDGWSPEHGPVEKDGRVVLREGDRTPLPGVSYDQQIVWDLFTNFLNAAMVLDVDPELRARVTGARSRLRGPHVGRWGQLQEWLADVDDPQDQHRHVSHLFGLYPGRQISPLLDPAIADAAKVSLTARGDAAAGWSRAWKLNFWARLGDGDHAESVLRGLLKPVAPGSRDAGTLPNLFSSGPPFQMDANFGLTAGIAEMLLQSQLRDEASGAIIVQLLPALPSAWRAGSVTGLRARGGLQVDLAWAEGSLTKAQVRSMIPASVVLRYRSEVRRVQLMPGVSYHWD